MYRLSTVDTHTEGAFSTVFYKISIYMAGLLGCVCILLFLCSCSKLIVPNQCKACATTEGRQATRLTRSSTAPAFHWPTRTLLSAGLFQLSSFASYFFLLLRFSRTFITFATCAVRSSCLRAFVLYLLPFLVHIAHRVFFSLPALFIDFATRLRLGRYTSPRRRQTALP